MRSEEHRFEPHHRGVAGREVRDRLDARLSLNRRRDDERAHSRPRGRVVVDVDVARLSRLADRVRELDEAFARAAEGRVELDGHDPLTLAQRAGKTCLQELLPE